MGSANVVSIMAKPKRQAHLCFEIGGILDTCNAELGQWVDGWPNNEVCGEIRTAGTVAGDPSRLVCDADGVVGRMLGRALASLRNEDRKAALDSAVNTRQNVYFTKYAQSDQVISTIRGNYSRTSPASNFNLVDRLKDIATQQYAALNEAYQVDLRTGVVRETESNTETSARSGGDSKRAGKFHQESVGRTLPQGLKVPETPPVPWEGFDTVSGAWTTTGYPSRQVLSTPGGLSALTVGVNFEQANNGGWSSGSQRTTHLDYEYKTPSLDAQARYLRSQISLNDQKFSLYMFERNLPHLERIFQNELATIDDDVYQLQIALVRSFIVSPVSGVVTAVYKRPGEAVGPGEPVVRVEDNADVELTASLVHQGAIKVGAAATIETRVGGPQAAVETLNGRVLAARGQSPCSRWDVVIAFDNRKPSGGTVLPLGYVFDADFTEVIIA